MSDTLASVKNIISIIMALFLIPVNMIFPTDKHEAKRPDEVKTSFSVVSDCHIEGNNYETFKVFTKILKDAEATDKKDAMVFLGDNTMNGQEIESIFFFTALRFANPADNLIVAAGNHDYSNGEGDYQEHLNRYLKYNNNVLGAKIDKPYFYKVINGCYFVVLSSEDKSVNNMYITDTQLNWLDGVLAEADSKGAPIFVFNHHPSLYVQYDRMYDLNNVLKKYDNLLYFSGHTHNALSGDTVTTIDGVNHINLPKVTEHAYGQDVYDCGIGAVVEVYENEVLLRIRDFYDGKWVEEYEYSYPIVK